MENDELKRQQSMPGWTREAAKTDPLFVPFAGVALFWAEDSGRQLCRE